MPTYVNDPVVSKSNDLPAIHGEASGPAYHAAIKGEHKADGVGLFGVAEAGEGVHGRGNSFGVRGWATANNATAVAGEALGGTGVYGKGRINGVWGEATEGVGVLGISELRAGVEGVTVGALDHPGVRGEHRNGGVGVFGDSARGVGVDARGGQLAGRFQGNVDIWGTLKVNADIVCVNADCAEDFEIVDAESIEPGTLMVIGDEGVLHQSNQPYDRRVAGVISGGGAYKPGIILDKQQPNPNRKPLALLGKVFCKVDARYAPIEVGDLLTTSGTPGQAMKAADPLKAFGAVIGKALRPLREGQGLIPILITLQ